MSKNVIPRIDLRSDLIPNPFCAPGDVVQKNCQRTLELLGVPLGSRAFSLAMDETCWFPTLDLVAGLKDDGLTYVGGYFFEDPEHDYSYLDLAQMKAVKQDDVVARLTQHYVLTRIDTNKHVYCVCFVPRPPKAAGLVANGALHTFCEAGQILLSACDANIDKPPMSVAYDAGTAHCLLNWALLGLVRLDVGI